MCFYYWVIGLLFMFCRCPVSDMICKYFIPYCELSFHFPERSIVKVFNFDEVHFFFLMFMLCLIWGHEIFSTSHIFFKEFASLALTVRQKPFELMFVHGMRKHSNFILLQMVSSCKWYPVVPHTIYWKTILSPLWTVLAPLMEISWQ